MRSNRIPGPRSPRPGGDPCTLAGYCPAAFGPFARPRAGARNDSRRNAQLVPNPARREEEEEQAFESRGWRAQFLLRRRSVAIQEMLNILFVKEQGPQTSPPTPAARPSSKPLLAHVVGTRRSPRENPVTSPNWPTSKACLPALSACR
jgi:hypothetical protein